MKIKIILSDTCDGHQAGTELEVNPEDVQRYQDVKVVKLIVNQNEYDGWLKSQQNTDSKKQSSKENDKVSN